MVAADPAYSAAYDAERQLEENRPVDLYTLFLDAADGGTVYYVNHPEDVTFPTAGQLYTALGVKRSPITRTLDLQVQSLKAQLDDVTTAFASLVASGVEFDQRRLLVQQVFLDQLGDAKNAVIKFDGKMLEPVVDQLTFTMEIISKQSAITKMFPGRRYQAPCPWAKRFGTSVECTIVPAPTAAGVTVVGSTTTTINVTDRAEATDYWTFGILTIAGEKRRIKKFTQAATQTIELDYGVTTAPGIGVAYTIEQGCDGTPKTCTDVHNNMVNYGGILSIPNTIITQYTQKFEQG